ncbi:MAG: hypothetical protein CMJ89_04625 [Planctomycetes bacterium]|nr:hypothetical protein [Planctomycetota bacterium]
MTKELIPIRYRGRGPSDRAGSGDFFSQPLVLLEVLLDAIRIVGMVARIEVCDGTEEIHLCERS